MKLGQFAVGVGVGGGNGKVMRKGENEFGNANFPNIQAGNILGS